MNPYQTGWNEGYGNGENTPDHLMTIMLLILIVFIAYMVAWNG